MKQETINRNLLKRLIKEVIREVDALATEKPSTSAEGPKGTSDDTMKHSVAAEKKRGDLMVTLSLKGLKSGPALKKFLAKLAYDAKMNDLEAIHAEIEKSATGQKVASMDITDLQQASKGDPEDKWDTSPYRRPRPEIVPGSGEAEWKAMTARDVAAAREKAKQRRAAGLPPEKDDDEG